MNRSRIPIGTLCLLALTSTAAAQEPEAIVLRGETMEVWPIENLAARGFNIRELPRGQNAAWVYIEAINAYADLPNELRDAFDYTLKNHWPEGVPALERYLTEPGNRKAAELARRATGMKECQMPYFGDPSQSVVDVLLPNLSHMRFLSKLLVVEGKQLEATGRYQQAAELYGVVMDMGHHAAQGCTLIESLVGVAGRARGPPRRRRLPLVSSPPTWECPAPWWGPRPSKPMRGRSRGSWWVRFPSTPVIPASDPTKFPGAYEPFDVHRRVAGYDCPTV